MSNNPNVPNNNVPRSGPTQNIHSPLVSGPNAPQQLEVRTDTNPTSKNQQFPPVNYSPMLISSKSPVSIVCPNCHVQDYTRVEQVMDKKMVIMLLLIALFLICALCCLCCDMAKKSKHYCRHCGFFLGENAEA